MNYQHTPWSNLFGLLTYISKPGDIFEEFEADLYRTIHDDLKFWRNDDLLSHYTHHGIREGRLASPAAHRIGFVNSINRDVDILEIGPFTKPCLTGANVKYFDVLNSTELIERARLVGYPSEGCPEIDFVSPIGDLGIVETCRFDIVFSSHCIEHQPDLISHLSHIDRILRPDGKCYLIIPDKRFCFDYYLNVSDIASVVAAHDERRKVHSLKSVFDHFVLTTHTSSLQHWRGEHEDPNLLHRADRARAAVEVYEQAKGGYIDVHAWQFTPESFRGLISDLNRSGLINLEPHRVYQTIWGQNEFTAILTKSR